MVSDSVSNIPPENSWYIIQCIVPHWSDTMRIKAYATWSNSVYVCNLNQSTGEMAFNWEKLISNSDLQWEVVTHNTELSNHQVDGKTLFLVEYTANKQIVGFAPMQPNLIIHGIYRNSAEMDYLIVTNGSGENIPNIEINVKVLFANFSK